MQTDYRLRGGESQSIGKAPVPPPTTYPELRELALCCGLRFLWGGLFCSLKASLLCFVFGHELAVLGCAVELAILVVDLGAGVDPHQPLGLGVGNFLRC